MKLQTFETLSTIWTVDTEGKTYLRTAKHAGPHPTFAYGARAVPFSTAVLQDNAVHFHGPHMHDHIRSGTLLDGETFDDTETRP